MKLVTLSSLGLSALLAAPALADVVHLRDGRRLEGAVTLQGGDVIVRHRWGQVRVPQEDVEKVEETDDPWDQLQRLRRELGQGTADERYRFAEWARTQGFHAEARLGFMDVLRVDPDHPGARAALGYVLEGGRWITIADRNRAQGLVEHEGEWMTPAEKTRRLEERRLAREREREAREQKELARAEERERKQKEREEERAARRERQREAALEYARARAQADSEAQAYSNWGTRFYVGPGGGYYPVGWYPGGVCPPRPVCGPGRPVATPYGGTVTGVGGVYYGGCYPYGSYGYSGWGYSSSIAGFYNGGDWGIRFRFGF